MEKNKYKKLAGNTLLFAIANFGTKLISFLLVPLYTYTLTKAEYGIVDLILTTISMLSPIFALSIADAVFRYSMDEKEVSSALTNGLLITFLGSLVVLVITPIFSLFKIPFPLLFSNSLVLSLFVGLLQNYARAAGFERSFAWSGVVSGVVISVANIIFLVRFKMGVKGYMLSIILAYTCVVLYLFLSLKLWKKIDISSISVKKIKKYLQYSIPLIPNAFSWWFTNDANRYFILFFVGASGNGLYAVANKIPSLLNMIYNIFSQAWQMSAVEEFESKDGKFYSSILNWSVYILLVISCTLLAFIKTFMHYFVAPSYYDSWKFVSFLLLAAIFSNISAFLGTIFLAAKETKSILSTTFLGMITNLIFNLILIPIFGVNGAGIGSGLGFMIVSIVRLIIVNKRYVKISIDQDLLIPCISFVLIMIINFIVDSELLKLNVIMNCGIVILTIIMFIVRIYKQFKVNKSHKSKIG